MPRTKRGGEKFCQGGFCYWETGRSTDGETTFWNCELRDHKDHKCKGRIWRNGQGRVSKTVTKHNHAPSKIREEVHHALDALKETARDGVLTTAQVLNNAASLLNLNARGALPSQKSMKRTIQRTRVAHAGAPPNPISRADIVIPGDYRVYEIEPERDEQFLFWDSLDDGIPAEERILLYTTRRNLDILGQAKQLAADGTFDLAPPLFAQLYSIHGMMYGGMNPLVYCLLPNKTQVTYRRVLTKLKDLCPNLNPESVMMDFELAAINAYEAELPNTQNTGCFFHLCKRAWSHVRDNGLEARYQADINFELKVRMIPALAFVPPHDVVEAFENLELDEPALTPIFNWLEEYYIGRRNRRGNGRQNPRFPIPLWNQYHRVLNKQIRSNNHVEAWHRGTQAMLQMVNPTIWKCIEGLQKCQKKHDTIIEQNIAGRAPTKESTTDKRLFTIVSDYENRDIESYLRGIAHNFSL